MASRKHEKAMTAPSGFWSGQNHHPGGRKGSSSGGGGGGGGAPLTFQAFEASVSDAWDICDVDIGGQSQAAAELGMGVIDVQPGGRKSLSTSSITASTTNTSSSPPPPASKNSTLSFNSSTATSSSTTTSRPNAASSSGDGTKPSISPAVTSSSSAEQQQQQLSTSSNVVPISTSIVTSTTVSSPISKPKHVTTNNGGSPSSIASSRFTENSGENKKFAKLEALLDSPSFELEELRKLAWPGISSRARPKAWKTLCGYLPPQSAPDPDQAARRLQEVVQRKRDEYARYVKQYFATREEDVHGDTYRQIHIDIPRMSPVVGLFQQRCVQEIFERILYIWAIRHPASGYVQGINDLVTPFFLVFLHDALRRQEPSTHFDVVLSDNLNVEQKVPLEERDEIEADSFWCLTKILDGIQDNYTFAQPGIQLKVKQLEELIRRIDSDLHNHLVGHDVVYLQFAFRWMNNLLMRELPIRATVRLWDTYLAQADGYSHFHLYVCAAFLIRWKADLMKKSDFHTLLMFLQNLPTNKWGDSDIDLLVAEAYRLSYLFAGAPSHLSSSRLPGGTTTALSASMAS